MAARMKTLLERRILEFNIPKLPGVCAFDRVAIYQLPNEETKSKTFIPDGLLVKPEDVHSDDQERTPRGIIVSAGLSALDYMHDHGMELGDIVWMSSQFPWRFKTGHTRDGKPIEFFFMYVGDLTLSEGVMEKLERGELAVERGADGKHRYVKPDRRVKDDAKLRRDPKRGPDEI